MRNILIIGHSHIGALQRAHQERGDRAESGAAFEFAPINNDYFKPNIDNTGALHPKIAHLVTRPRFDAIVSIIGGNAHCCLGLVNNPRPYDFVHPELPDLALDQQAQILPYRLMMDVLRDMARDITPILPAIAALTDKPIWHLHSPPPVGDATHLKAHALHFDELIRAYGLSMPERAYRFWRLQCSMMDEICAPLDIPTLMPPAETMDENGMLAPACWSDDPTHAGTAFGQAQLDRIATLAQTQAKSKEGAVAP